MNTDIECDAELISRYDRNGPRYTSYPTAPQFHARFDAAAYRRAALISNAEHSAPLSLYIHIPFCASPCFYCGCNKVITSRREKAERYLTVLEREIAMQSPLFAAHRKVEQIHFGGGTPTYLTVEQIQSILEQLERHFHLQPRRARQQSIEIDPRTLAPGALRRLANLGFNRLSLGIQDFDPHVQRAVNREQSPQMVRTVVEEARAAGFESMSFDLIYGLPLQTPSSFLSTLQTTIALAPDRIAVYGYAHLPQMFKPQRQIIAEQLPSAAARLALHQQAVRTLTQAGYVYIGMDHFALPTDELFRAQQSGSLHRNFQGYSTHADCDLVGLGVSAIHKVGHAYAQNQKTLNGYYAALERGELPIERGLTLNVDDRLRRDIIQDLMCYGRVDIAALESDYAIDFAEYFAQILPELDELAADGLVTRSAEQISVTPRGRLLVRHVAMSFDAYLKRSDSSGFSKAI